MPLIINQLLQINWNIFLVISSSTGIQSYLSNGLCQTVYWACICCKPNWVVLKLPHTTYLIMIIRVQPMHFLTAKTQFSIEKPINTYFYLAFAIITASKCWPTESSMKKIVQSMTSTVGKPQILPIGFPFSIEFWCLWAAIQLLLLWYTV